MRRGLPRVVVFIAVALTIVTIHAHHSIAGIYDSSTPVTIDGIVSEFHFVNPHPFLLVMVGESVTRAKGETGRPVEWRLEMDNRVELVEIGMTARTLKPGDRVIARGSRGRENAASLYVMRLDRPADGFWYEQVGSTPRMRK